MLRKAVCVICVAVCGAQVDVSLTNDTKSSFNVEGARGQLAGVAKGNATSGITLRSGMAATADCDIAAKYSFDGQVSIGSGCSEAACQDQEMVQGIKSAQPTPIKMLGVYYAIQKSPSCNIAIGLWYDDDWTYGFKVAFRCKNSRPVQVRHFGTMISVAFGWSIVLELSASITAVHTDQNGNEGTVSISIGDPSNSVDVYYIESVTLSKPTGQPELLFGASIQEKRQCDFCYEGPAMYYKKKSLRPFNKVTDLHDSPPYGVSLCASE